MDKRDHVKVEDFDYIFNDGNLTLVIQVQNMVCVMMKIVIETSAIPQVPIDDEDIVSEIEESLREEEVPCTC